MSGVDTDRNLLFAVLALQADLIDRAQFVEACTAWATRKESSIAELLVARGWLDAAGRDAVEVLARGKLRKHGGDPGRSLAAVADPTITHALAEVEDPEVQHTIGGSTEPEGHVLLSTIAYTPGTRERFVLSRLHARGGLGQVWLARDDRLGREVALKELRPERAGDPTVWARFLEEARITGQLEHPGIVPVYELSQAGEGREPFYTMRFVRGRTLAEAIRAFHKERAAGAAGPLDRQALLTAFVGVCHAVAYAHSRGVIHRDLKPQNVVLGDFGEVIVLDWGLAKVVDRPEDAAPPASDLERDAGPGATQPGQALGTPAYMAPEQAEGKVGAIDHRTDVYGLGAILYEILADGPPFHGDDTAEVLRRVIAEEPERPRARNPEAPAPLEAVTLTALAKDPGRRYPSASELAREVQRFLADEPVAAYPEPWPARLGRWARQHRPLVSGAAALLITAVVALAVGLVLIGRERDRTEAARKAAQKNFEAAEAQRRRALANFRKARDAVDRMLTRVGDRSLRHVPQMETLRRRLLEDALEFNREFLRDEGGDLDVRREAARAYRRAGDIHEMLGRNREADAEFARAVALAEGVTMFATSQPTDQLDLADHLQRRAQFLAVVGRPAEAEADWSKAEARLRARAAARPGDPRPRRSLGFVEHNRGTMLYKIGRHPEAERALRAAIAIREALAAAEPDDLELQYQVATGYNNLANLLEAMTRMADAEAAHRRALARLERLVAQAPDNPEYRSYRAISLGNFGLLLKATGRLPEAEAHFRQALEIHRKLATDFPDTLDYTFKLAATTHNLGLVLQELGRIREAEAADRETARLWEDLVARAPAVPEYRDNLAHAQNTLGNIGKNLGRVDEAEAAYRRARAIWEQLTAEYPKVPNYREGSAHVDNNLAILLEVARGRVAEAERMYRHAIGTWTDLVADYPASADYRHALAMARSNLADLLAKRPDGLDAARSEVEEGLREEHEALRLNPKQPTYRAGLRQLGLVRAILLARQGDHDAAARAIEETLALPGRHPTDPYNAACLLARCAAAARDDRRLQPADRDRRADRYAARALEMLAVARSSGFFQEPARLDLIREDPDLDPIRSRPGFQDLARDLAFPDRPFAP